MKPVQKLVLATRNRDKVKEIKDLLSDTGIALKTLDDFPGAPEVEEDGATLEENAIKKAKQIADYTGLTSVADDTGLEVEYLGGRPGVFSSRYSGEGATYAENVAKLLRDLQSVPWEERGARFRCVVALCHEGEVYTVEGVCEGVISEAPRGENGFGYDPVFYVPQYERTFAEMSSEEKNRISHRAKAFQALKRLLLELSGSKSGRSAVR